MGAQSLPPAASKEISAKFIKFTLAQDLLAV